MKKQLLLVAMAMTLAGVNGCSAMGDMMGDSIIDRTLKLWIDNPTVKIIIPLFKRKITITGKIFKGTEFSFPEDTDEIGVQFPGEDEPHYFDLNQLRFFNGPLTITVITKDKRQNSVELEDAGQTRIMFIENK